MLPAIMFAILAAQAGPDPARHSEQCLAEIAALAGNAFSPTDDQARANAMRKADFMIASYGRVLRAEVQLETLENRRLASVRSSETAGELPEGTYAAAAEDVAIGRANRRSGTPTVVTRAPSCAWPVEPAGLYDAPDALPASNG